MLDINYIRQNIEKVQTSIKARKSEVSLDDLLKLDDERRSLILKVDSLRSKKNTAAKAKDIQAGTKVKAELEALEKQLTGIEEHFQDLMLRLPNVLSDEVPVGDEHQNKVIRQNGQTPKFDFTPKDHLELGRSLGIIDTERGVKVSGYRGYFLTGQGAMLQLAVLNFALDQLVEKGYELIIPPVIDRKFALEGSGQFPWHQEETYKIEEEEMYLAGTSEVPVMAMYSDEILSEKDLPKKFVALSPCFRTEIGSYGKDTKGLYRVHEFYKVEQIVLAPASLEQTTDLFSEMQQNAEEIVQALGLPYQVVVLSSEDMGQKSYLTYDLETWIPARNSYGETHSNSILLDFQTRRLKIRYKDKDGTIKYAYSLNNTAIASPRILIPLLENFQLEDGSVKIPEVLVPYTNFSQIKPKS
ncbi:serine--tRNA ligase [Candidatus Daviesbacteria bacterium]|nr:serine--tRNA ligase [Candidatus Daviesbacteria bacterium]